MALAPQVGEAVTEHIHQYVYNFQVVVCAMKKIKQDTGTDSNKSEGSTKRRQEAAGREDKAKS